MKRKLYTLCMALLLVCGQVFAIGGKCGNHLKWNLDGNGVLTISGIGAMKDYKYRINKGDYNTPWYSYHHSITSIQISEGVTSIGEGAFYKCSGLTSVKIPNSVTSIGNRAFFCCYGLTSVKIPNSVTSIGESAFYGCSGLTSVMIPNSVTSIGLAPFCSCEKLTSISVASGNSYYSSSNGVLFNYNKTTLIQYPGGKSGSYSIPNSVTSIGSFAFEYCSGLTSVTIPNSVTSIGNFAFEYCSGLTSIEIPNSVTSIGIWAFYGCSGLTSIEIPNSVTSIGSYAFYKCSGLTSVEIPNSVTSIGYSAFSHCDSLKEIICPKGLDISTADIPSSAKLIAYTPTNSSSSTTTASSGSTSATNSATTSQTAYSSTTSQSTTHPQNTYAKPTTSGPICTILSPGDKYTYYSNSTISIRYKVENLSEGQTIEYYVDDPKTKSFPIQGTKGVRVEQGTELKIDIPQSGTHVVGIRVMDAYGMRSEDTRTFIYRSVHKPTLHVFAVGISEYDYAKTGLQKLQSGAKDAQDFVNTINSLDLSIYKEVKPIIILDKEATANNIRLRLKELADNVDQEDVVMLFFSGHGMTENNLFYFMTHGVRVNECVNALKFNDIVDQMQRMKNKDCHVFIFMDACHSGGMYGQAKGAKETISSAAPDIVGFYSSTADEESRELNGNGLFTRALIDGLKGNGVANDNGQITIHSLRNYITNALKDAPQTPIFNTKGKDYILFYKKK